MPKSAHTQGLLDEVRAPKHASRATAEAAVLSFLPTLLAVGREASEIAGRARLAEIAEEDASLRGLLELYAQTAGAMDHARSTAEQALREIVAIYRQLHRYDAEIRAAAAERGYTP